MDIKSIIGKAVVVWCKTEKESQEFVDRCKGIGIDCNGVVIHSYQDETCYRVNFNKKLCYGSRNNYVEMGYDIIQYTNFGNLFNIYITSKNNKITATMRNLDGKYIKHATAKCNPEDKFNYEFGKKLALSRLFDLDTESLISDNNSPRLLDTITGEECGIVGDLTTSLDVNREKLYIGDIVKVVSSRHQTRLALVCDSHKGYILLHCMDNYSLYSDGTGSEDGAHFFIVKEESYKTLKIGDVFDYIKVVE